MRFGSYNRSSNGAGPRARFPFDPAPRITRFHLGKPVPASCEALAGWTSDLLGLARGILARERPPVDVSHALLPFSRAPLLLDEPSRDLLWAAFEVPLFVQYVDASGTVAAFECEAHRSLHLVGSAPAGAELLHSPCDCGKPGPRLLAHALEACAIGYHTGE